MIFSSAIDLIGHTPVVDISRLCTNPSVKLLVKLEGQNPFGSFKDRVARSMLEDAMQAGILYPGQRLVAPSSGNTGISLAGVGGMMGHPVTIVMPSSASQERRQTLAFLGADLVLTHAELGTGGAIEKAHELARNHPDWCLLDQYSSEANACAHFETTGPEIWRHAPDITHFIAGIGSGGSLVGVGRFLKQRNPSVAIIAAEPEGGHPIEGVRSLVENHEPALFLKWQGRELVDSKLRIRHLDSLRMTRRLALECGVFAGPSSGMALSAALEIAAGLDSGTVLFLACDGGWKYLTTLVGPELNTQRII